MVTRAQRACPVFTRGVLARRARLEALHLPDLRQPPQRFDLDLAHSLAGETEPAADLLERLRLGVDEAVTEDDHLALTPWESRQRLLERLAPQRHLDLLVREWAVAGDEVAEHGVVLIPDRLIEARRGSCARPDLLRLTPRQVRLLGAL